MKTQNELNAEQAKYDKIQEDWDGDEMDHVPRKPRFSFPCNVCGPFLNKRHLIASNPDEPF